MTLDELKVELEKIRKSGCIPTARKGPTGVGHTLEKILGLKENNIALPDVEGAELKAHRDEGRNLITLFTFNKKAWVMKPLDAIHAYGSKDKNGRLGLYYTISLTPNSAGLFLSIDDKTITVKHTSGAEVVKWQLEAIKERLEQKIPALVLVSARTEERGGKEHFEYYRTRLLKNPKANLLKDLFQSKDIVVDLRLHEKKTSARNHGTGFRIFENKFLNLFGKIEDIL